MNQYIEAKKSDIQNSIEHYKKDISSLRTGRANPSVFESVLVEAYGTKNPINSVANINIGDGASMVIAPFDKNVIKDIEKAIVEAHLGLGVVNEGDKLRVTVPRMTEENRKDLVKMLNEKHEKSRISIRQIRDDIKESIEKAFEAKEVTEDDKFRFIKELEEEVGRTNDELKAIRDKKEQDIMTV